MKKLSLMLVSIIALILFSCSTQEDSVLNDTIQLKNEYFKEWEQCLNASEEKTKEMFKIMEDRAELQSIIDDFLMSKSLKKFEKKYQKYVMRRLNEPMKHSLQPITNEDGSIYEIVK